MYTLETHSLSLSLIKIFDIIQVSDLNDAVIRIPTQQNDTFVWCLVCKDEQIKIFFIVGP